MSVSILPFQFPGLEKVHCAFQVRVPESPVTPLSGGNISFSVGDDPCLVEKNRRELLQLCGLSQWAELNQVHKDSLLFEPTPVDVAARPGPEANADGMATSREGLGLLIKTADCQSVLVAHKSGRYIAAFHFGWRGDRLLFPITGVRRFCQHYKIRPEDCLAVRGPSLGPGKAEFVNFDREWGSYFGQYFTPETKTVDLWRMTRDQLEHVGIPKGNIFGIDLCTASLPNLFFSYRLHHGCGRQASLIWIA